MREKATRASIRTKARPSKTAELSVGFTLTNAEYHQLRYGFVPQNSDERWFVYEAEQCIHFYRSWTGYWYGAIRFEKTADGYRAIGGTVNRDPHQNGATNDARDCAKLEDVARQVIDINADILSMNRPSGPVQNGQKLQELLALGAIALEPAPILDAAPPLVPEGFDFGRVEAMLLGLAIGDALGNTSEGKLPGERRSRHGEISHYLPNLHADGRAVGTPSDDSQLAFWTLEQLNADGGLLPERLARRLSSQQIFGIGHAMTDFLRHFTKEKVPWEKAGAHSAGNGALMRIAPILIPHLVQPSSGLWADAALAAMITHNDRASTASCIAFVSLLWSALQLAEPPAPGWWLKGFLEVAGPLEGGTQLEPRFDPHQGRFKGSLPQFVEMVVGQALKADRTLLDAADEWGSGAYLLETVPCVLYILERHAHTPEEAILRAVNDTKDNDTIAAIVGAAMGALHGRKALKPEWLADLTGRTSETDDGRIFEVIDEARELWIPIGSGQTNAMAD